MRYLGSKAGALPSIEKLIPPPASGATFADPFGGIGIVGAHARTLGYQVHAGDILRCANAFQTAKLRFTQPPLPTALRAHLGIETVEDLLQYLNTLRPISSWVVREFSENRQYFTRENATKIDAVRRELWRLKREGVLEGPEHKYYLASFISSTDAVANTAGTYYAHLKSWDRKAQRPFIFRPLNLPSGPKGHAHLVDAGELVSKRFYDVLYLDPPYNQRDYAGYYHLPETFATGRRPRPSGKSGVDKAARPVSKFVRPRSAAKSISELLHLARFRRLIFHYSDNGLITPEQIRTALNDHGEVAEHVIDATGYSSSGSRSTMHRIYVVTR